MHETKATRAPGKTEASEYEVAEASAQVPPVCSPSGDCFSSRLLWNVFTSAVRGLGNVFYLSSKGARERSLPQ